MRRTVERILSLDEDAFETDEKELKPYRRADVNPAECAARTAFIPEEEDEQQD
jgi:hypothetical protein